MSGGLARAATMTSAHTHEAPRIVLTGGGTGGHVYPALAIAGALRRRRPEAELLFVGGDRLEARVVPRAGMSFRGITVHGIAGRGLSGASRRLRAAVELSLGLPLLQSIARLRDFRPHVVIGTGGYVSGPVILAARLMGIPSLAVEGNRSPGWTSRAVVRLVDVMAVAHPEMAAFFASRVRRGGRVEVTGLPVRAEITTTARESGAAALDIDPSLTTLLVFGGSLGSRRMNDAVLSALHRLREKDERFAGVQVLHVTGTRYAGADRDTEGLPRHYRAFAYLDPHYAEAMAAADLVIARSGASTVAEITARGLPAVLIPWSGASTQEQVRNAEPLAECRAAVVIHDHELTGERLAEVLAELLQNPEKRGRMADASRRLGHPDAAQRVALLALQLAEEKAPRQGCCGATRGGRSA